VTQSEALNFYTRTHGTIGDGATMEPPAIPIASSLLWDETAPYEDADIAVNVTPLSRKSQGVLRY